MAEYTETITDPIIELLAIKLFEHDADSLGKPPSTPRMGWMNLCNDDRECYRKMARGQSPIGNGSTWQG